MFQKFIIHDMSLYMWVHDAQNRASETHTTGNIYIYI